MKYQAFDDGFVSCNKLVVEASVSFQQYTYSFYNDVLIAIAQPSTLDCDRVDRHYALSEIILANGVTAK